MAICLVSFPEFRLNPGLRAWRLMCRSALPQKLNPNLLLVRGSVSSSNQYLVSWAPGSVLGSRFCSELLFHLQLWQLDPRWLLPARFLLFILSGRVQTDNLLLKISDDHHIAGPSLPKQELPSTICFSCLTELPQESSHKQTRFGSPLMEFLNVIPSLANALLWCW